MCHYAQQNDNCYIGGQLFLIFLSFFTLCVTRFFVCSFICIKDHSVSAAATAAILAHEMGHNFGFLHDEDSKCVDLEYVLWYLTHLAFQPKQCAIKTCEFFIFGLPCHRS